MRAVPVCKPEEGPHQDRRSQSLDVLSLQNDEIHLLFRLWEWSSVENHLLSILFSNHAFPEMLTAMKECCVRAHNLLN